MELRAPLHWLRKRVTKGVEKATENAVAYLLVGLAGVAGVALFWLRDPLSSLLASKLRLPLWVIVVLSGIFVGVCAYLVRRVLVTEAERDQTIDQLRQARNTPRAKPTVKALGFDWEIESHAFNLYRHRDRRLDPNELDSIITGPLCSDCKRLVQVDHLLAGPRGGGYVIAPRCQGCGKETGNELGLTHTYLAKEEVFRDLQAKARRSEFESSG